MMVDDKKHVGSSTKVDFPEIDLTQVPARIDTGARLSSIWASAAKASGGLMVTFFAQDSPLFSGRVFTFPEYDEIVVSSSMGHLQKRYKITLLVKVRGKKVRAAFTLADRSKQAYPVLIGRNVLRGKFVVDVKKGAVLLDQEKALLEERQSKVTEWES